MEKSIGQTIERIVEYAKTHDIIFNMQIINNRFSSFQFSENVFNNTKVCHIVLNEQDKFCAVVNEYLDKVNEYRNKNN